MSRQDAPRLFVRLLTESGDTVRVASDEILSFEYIDSDRRADLCKLTVDNSTLQNFDDPAWRKGAKLDVQWGYPGNMAPTRRVVITGVSGFSTLAIEARAESVLMNTIAKTRVFENATHSEVVRQIAEENGWSGDAVDIEDTTERFEVVTQPRLTDAQMIRRLAARAGFEFYVDVDGLHFHARRLAQRPIRTFRYFTDRVGLIIGEPTIENDVTAKPGRVRVRGRDPVTREDIDATADNESDEDREGLGGILDLIDFDSGDTFEQAIAQEDVRPTTAATQEGAEQEARARYRRAQQVAVKMKLPVIGDPGLLAKTVVQLEGMGRRLSVRYYVSEVRHNLGSDGYKCELALVSDGHGGHDTTSHVAEGLDLVSVGAETRARQNTEDAPNAGEGNGSDPDEPGELFAFDLPDLDGGGVTTEWRQTPPRGRNET